MRNINQLTPDNRFQLPEHLRPPMFASKVAEHNFDHLLAGFLYGFDQRMGRLDRGGLCRSKRRVSCTLTI